MNERTSMAKNISIDGVKAVPGMKVRNKLTDSIGVLRFDPKQKTKLRSAGPGYVAVVRKSGGKLHYPYWFVSNLAVVE